MATNLDDCIKNFTGMFSRSLLGEGEWFPMVKQEDGTILINYDGTYQDWRLAIAYADYCSASLDASEIGVSSYDPELDRWTHYDSTDIQMYDSQQSEMKAERDLAIKYDDAGWMDTFEEEDRRLHGYRF